LGASWGDALFYAGEHPVTWESPTPEDAPTGESQSHPAVQSVPENVHPPAPSPTHRQLPAQRLPPEEQMSYSRNPTLEESQGRPLTDRGEEIQPQGLTQEWVKICHV
jgi:hypothetical protein